MRFFETAIADAAEEVAAAADDVADAMEDVEDMVVSVKVVWGVGAWWKRRIAGPRNVAYFSGR